jgi:hypothetical protein
MEEFSKFLKDKLGEHEPEDVNWENKLLNKI